jgi:hypothetical protein
MNLSMSMNNHIILHVMFQHWAFKNWGHRKSLYSQVELCLDLFLHAAASFREVISFSAVMLHKGLCWLSHMAHNSRSLRTHRHWKHMLLHMQRVGLNM